MIDQQDRIGRIRTSLQPEIDRAVQEAASAFLGGLGDQPCPGEVDVAAATDAARSRLKHHLLSEHWVAIITGEKRIDPGQMSRLELVFDSVMPPLAVPQPQDASTMSPARLAWAAAVGAVLGMMIVTPLTRLSLNMLDTGLFLGAPIGAALLVLASWHTAHSKWVRNTLIAGLGVATAAELWALLSGGWVLSRLWQKAGGRQSGIHRMLIYTCAILVLVFSKRIPRIDRRGYEQTVVSVLNQWLDEALVLIVFLCGPNLASAASSESGDMLCALVAKIRALPLVAGENTEVAIQELIQETKNMGFSGDEGPRQVVWEDAMRDEYETFAHVEPGDFVIVEREPVRFQDTVKRKGLVRKMRERS